MNIQLKNSEPVWHIVWTTWGTWPIYDSRGNWQELGALYHELLADEEDIALSKALPQSWRHQPNQEAITTTPSQQEQIKQDLVRLAKTDRVGSLVTPLVIKTSAQTIHFLCQVSEAKLHQGIGRLKSRSATLFFFNQVGESTQKRLWSKGFWSAQLHTESTINQINHYLQQEKQNG